MWEEIDQTMIFSLGVENDLRQKEPSQLLCKTSNQIGLARAFDAEGDQAFTDKQIDVGLEVLCKQECLIRVTCGRIGHRKYLAFRTGASVGVLAGRLRWLCTIFIPPSRG